MLRALFCIGFFIVGAAFSPVFAEAIAKVAALYGSSSANGRSLTVGSDIQEHDRISVASGNVQMIFVDGTKLVLGSGSTLVIEKFLMQSPGSAKNFSVNALRGTFRFITGASPKSAYKIKTANATIGIRGTGFDFWVAGRTGVALLNGRVRLCSGGQKCVNLAPRCDVGLAENSGAKLLRGFTKSFQLRSRFPYILDQSSLDRRFRLNVSACEKDLSLTGSGQGTAGAPTPCNPQRQRC